MNPKGVIWPGLDTGKSGNNEKHEHRPYDWKWSETAINHYNRPEMALKIPKWPNQSSCILWPKQWLLRKKVYTAQVLKYTVVVFITPTPPS